jgi:hypothetical protein
MGVSLIDATDGFVNLQEERPLRFGLSVNQTNSFGMRETDRHTDRSVCTTVA